MAQLKGIKVKQAFASDKIADVQAHTLKQLSENGQGVLPKGGRIAIAVGSRGIRDVAKVARATVDFVKQMGCEPFIIPAMGSHGNATDEGQREVLSGYGVSEETMDAPIVSSLEVVKLDSDGLENSVFIDKKAYEADGVIVINRIKVHTDFHGPTESGLTKMCVIGLGKHRQAIEIHRFGVYGLRNLIEPTARRSIKQGKVLLGVGIIENGYDETAEVHVLHGDRIVDDEPALLDRSRAMMPSLPLDKIDILIIDRIGKDISGSCMDTNIIGRMGIRGVEEPASPNVSVIIADDMTPLSHGNAAGIGLADFISRKLFDKLDLEATYENCVTSTFLDRAKIPVIAKDAYQAYQWALRTCGPIEIDDVVAVRIRDTLSLSEVYVSQGALKRMKNPVTEGDFAPMFGEDGQLIKVF